MNRSYILTLTAVLVILFLPGIPDSTNESSISHAQNGDGFLILNEISPWSSDDVVWVELLNPSTEPVQLSGWTIEFLSGFSYTFPPNSGEVLGGNLHVLNISGGNPLNRDGDGCILSGPEGPVDAITWGDPPLGTDIPVSFGAPIRPFYPILHEDQEIYLPDDVCMRVTGTDTFGTGDWVGSHHWLYRGDSDSSKGASNPPPPPLRYSPPDGAVLASDVSLYVRGFEWTNETTFQIAVHPDFQDIVLEETVEGNSLYLEDLPAGTYYWRVRGYTDTPGPWTDAHEFILEDIDIDALIEEAETVSFLNNGQPLLADHKGGQNPNWTLLTHHVIPCPHIYQKKDTRMVCIDGCTMGGNCAWCSPQEWRKCEHGNSNCCRASIAMAAAAGGCSLSQDYISWYLFEKAGNTSEGARDVGHLNDPFKDLGHNEGTFYNDFPLLLAWIYGQPAGNAKNVYYHSQIFDDLDRNDMDSIREFIINDRTVLRHSTTHTTLIVGCAIMLDSQANEVAWIKVHDPDDVNGVGWCTLESTKNQYGIFTFPPTTGVVDQIDDPGIYLDTDGDGLVDFDEEERFGTDPYNPDSDLDGVQDRQDILGYVFNSDGTYHPRDPDIDGDGAWKEMDIDNDWPDDNGMVDGCEDWNFDGFHDAAIESDCFYRPDDYDELNPACMTGIISYRLDIYDANPDSILTLHKYETIVIEDQPLTSEEYIHRHIWSFSHIETPFDPMGASQYAYNEGEGVAKAHLEADDDGNYYLTVDCRPSMGEFHNIFDWPELGDHDETDIPLGHIFGMNLRYFLGQPVSTEGGVLLLKGEIGPIGETHQGTTDGFQLDETTWLRQYWEIILEHPD